MTDHQSVRPSLGLLPELVNYAAGLRGLSPDDFFNSFYNRKITPLRFSIIWVARQVKPEVFSYPYLAKFFGFKDHTSVIHGFRSVEMLRDKDHIIRSFSDRLLAFAHSRMEQRRETAKRTMEEALAEAEAAV